MGSKASKKSLTYAHIQPLLDAHKALDGFERILNARGESRTVLEPYRFAKGTVYLAIAKNINRLQSALEDLNNARMALVKSMLKEGETSLAPTDPRYSKFVAEYSAMIDKGIAEVELCPIYEDDLCLDTNAISRSTLAVFLSCDLLKEGSEG